MCPLKIIIITSLMRDPMRGMSIQAYQYISVLPIRGLPLDIVGTHARSRMTHAPPLGVLVVVMFEGEET